jgi:uncharacterized membrane protein YphA (DoxX/SURF4 family)
VVGLKPWLPWPLSRSRWWTEPVRAERLAALRIGLAAVLLLDVLLTYLPHAHDFFGNYLGEPELRQSQEFIDWPHWRWSLLHYEFSSWLRGDWSPAHYQHDPAVFRGAATVWAVATFCLLIGLWTRCSALVVWLLSTSFAYLNPNIDNAGDLIRGITLFYLPLCPCGAVWSVDHWWQQRHGRATDPVCIPPWPLRLLFIQLVFIYFCNGLYKLFGNDWRSGNSLYYVLADLNLSRWSYAQIPLPYVLTRVLTWLVMAWEVSFPVLVCWRRTRLLALLFGVAFHLGIGASMELGGFVPYVLCLYLPLVPWERWVDSRKGRRPVGTPDSVLQDPKSGETQKTQA